MRMMPDEATPKVEEFEHRSKALDGYSEIDDLMLEVFAFDCPECGVDLNLDEFTEPPCPHLKFLYVHVVGDFVFMTEDVQSLLDECSENEEMESLSPIEILEKVWESDHRHTYLVGGDVGCGPCCDDRYYGIQSETVAERHS